ncbi:dTDP-4-amino-4,6-dideoxygalactose transaminase [Solirubrobacter ginsenosidimutans]|uniref:dTDP-4-amino-4,6-dideoxygalactose transaminase n=1 Tax=Solirubrobacter ginsenosidimutans TaxID=490573 RepID=A0A9X3S577_9ACTN|nr:dTDP-4-amino-4,6-dideoxygalactose transaminase [Solirubrobacter ginsenosidimutans]MDA0163876.1 dTDP-4-amino-4,6-dideoxygalactose transaminase [Solirubrobacter ginsenosidimutans]
MPRIPERIPFNVPEAHGAEATYVRKAVEGGALSGNGTFGRLCAEWLQRRSGTARAFMTSSCSAALEMSTRLAGVGPGDEVIMPSFTFVSTASAVVRCGGRPVFVDIDPETFNLDPVAVANAIGPRTRAISVVHYGGVAADMQAIMDVARRAGLIVVEDAAHCVGATWRGRALGTIGDLGTLSFHDTKNLQCGEGGALLVNEPALVPEAEIMLNRGTNRAQFARGEVDRYTWVGEGSNYLMSELNAAYLWAQFEQADAVTEARRALWRTYWEAFAELERQGTVQRPVVPDECEHNAHIFALLLPDRARRDALIAALDEQGVQAVFHYVPLHSSPAGRKLGREGGSLAVTDDISDRLVRLPLWAGLGEERVARVIASVRTALGACAVAV